MKKINLIVLALIFGSLSLHAGNKKLSVIKATANRVDIRDGKTINRQSWIVSPKLKPDVYITSSNKVTFITDRDSIFFQVRPNPGVYDFVILLNGKDSAYTQIKYQPSYLEKLRKAARYNPLDKRFVPHFTYQSQDSSELRRIRRELKLDSIAGKGPELLRIFNLMHWVHNAVRHDGSSMNPDKKNATDLLSICKKEKRGINCRMMATMLNECYLAIGIKSRFVTCMPREKNFDDCHVINMVYSYELAKWIWIDPTFDAYVMDDKGNILGIAEVRDRLIKGLPLVLNADANWNHQQLQTKDYYLKQYMAKNLYRLQCPVSSECNTETYADEKTVIYTELLPLDALEQEPQRSEDSEPSMQRRTRNHVVLYKTNNPALFWTKPE